MNHGVIIADKRTASTFLQFALDSHPDILALDEMFIYSGKAKKRSGYPLYRTMQKDKGWNLNKYLNYLSELNNGKSVVFKLMYNQNTKYGNLLNTLKERNFAIFHLYREDQLKRVFSKLTSGELEPKPRRIDPADLFNRILQSNQKIKQVNVNLKNYDRKLIVEMTKIFGKREGEITNITKKGAFNIRSEQITYLDEKMGRDICALLNVEYRPMFSNISKKNRQPMEYYIKNKKEIIEYFKQKKRKKWVKSL